MGSDAIAILICSPPDASSKLAFERLARYASQHSGVPENSLLGISVLRVDLDLDPKSATDFFQAILSARVQRLYVGDASLYFGNSADAQVVLRILQREGLKIFGEDSSQSPLRQKKTNDLIDRTLDLEKRLREARLHTGRARNAISGGKRGGNPQYGTMEGESKVLDEIKALKKQGLGHTEIATRLNADSIKPRKGKKWYPAVVANILGVRRDAKTRKAKRLK